MEQVAEKWIPRSRGGPFCPLQGDLNQKSPLQKVSYIFDISLMSRVEGKTEGARLATFHRSKCFSQRWNFSHCVTSFFCLHLDRIKHHQAIQVYQALAPYRKIHPMWGNSNKIRSPFCSIFSLLFITLLCSPDPTSLDIQFQRLRPFPFFETSNASCNIHTLSPKSVPASLSSNNDWTVKIETIK